MAAPIDVFGPALRHGLRVCRPEQVLAIRRLAAKRGITTRAALGLVINAGLAAIEGRDLKRGEA